MKFGDDKWFEMLDKRVKFPAVIAFYVGNKKTLSSKVVESKSKNIYGMQYKTLEPPWFSGEHTALAKVVICETAETYYENAKKIMDAWGIEPDAESESA